MRALGLMLPDRAVLRELLQLAWPVVVGLLSLNMMLLADAFFVGQLGTVSLAGLGLAGTGVYLVRAFGNGLLGGVRVATAHAHGARAELRARRLAWQGAWLALGLGLGAWAVLPFSAFYLGLFGAEGELLDAALAWFRPVLLAAPFGFLGVASGGWLRARGDTRTPMRAEVVANALNIGLDALLVHGWGPVPALGVAGAGWATAVSIALAGSWQAFAVWRQVRGTPASPGRALLRQVWRLGAPLGLQWLLDVGAYAIFAGVLAASGEAHLAAHVFVVRLICISFLPGYGVAEAVGVMVGQAVGAGDPARAAQAWKAGVAVASGLMAAMGLVFVSFPEALLGALGASPEVMVIGVELLWIAAAFQVLDAVATVSGGALTGAGQTRFVLWVSVVGAWGIKVPLGAALALGAGMGAPGAWLGITAELVLSAAWLAWRAQRSAPALVASPAPAQPLH